MANYQEQILDLINQNPDIRTIQIVDAIELDIDIVENHLAAAIREKMIIMTPIIGQNMLKANSYKINTMHPYWKARTVAVAANVPATNVKVVRAPEVVKVRGKSKAQKALDYLAGRPSATRTELCTVLGIDPAKYHPTQYLMSQLKSGQIIRDGDIYKLGPASSQENTDPVKTFSGPSVANLPLGFSPAPEPEPRRVITAPSAGISLTLEKFEAVKNCLPPDEYKAFIKASVILCMMAGAEGFQVGAALAKQLADIDQGAAA